MPLLDPHGTVVADDGDQLGGDILPVVWHISKTFLWYVFFCRIDFNLYLDPYSITAVIIVVI